MVTHGSFKGTLLAVLLLILLLFLVIPLLVALLLLVGGLGLVLAGVVLALLFVRAVSSKVTQPATLEAGVLAPPPLLAVVAEPLDLLREQCELIISNFLQLLLCHRKQSRQSKGTWALS